MIVQFIVSAVLSRLDDPSAEVRLYAAQCIGELKLSMETITDLDSWKIVVKHVFDSLILHLDGPEIHFRKTLLGKTIEQLKIIFSFVKLKFQIRIDGKAD